MIDLVNVSNKPVIIEINGVLAGSVASDAKRNFEVELGEKTVITLRHDKISYKKGSKAHMHIETTYELSEIDQRTPLVIKYDQMHIDMGIYYHCFFLSQNGKVFEPKEYCIQGVEELKNVFANQGIIEMLSDALFELVLDMVFHPLITIASAIVIVLWLGWKWLLIILGVLYLLSLVGTIFGDWLFHLTARLIDKNHVKETMEQRIERLSQPEAISEFYNDPDGSKHMGK